MGPSIFVTLCDMIHSTSMWTPEFLLCQYKFEVLSHAHHIVVIEHEVAIGVVLFCSEREVGFLAFGSVCPIDRMYEGNSISKLQILI